MVALGRAVINFHHQFSYINLLSVSLCLLSSLTLALTLSLFLLLSLVLITKTFAGPRNIVAGKMNYATNTQRNNLCIFMAQMSTNGRVRLFAEQAGSQSGCQSVSQV